MVTTTTVSIMANTSANIRQQHQPDVYNYSSGLNKQPQLAIPSANINKIMNINIFPYTSWCNKKIARTTFSSVLRKLTAVSESLTYL